MKKDKVRCKEKDKAFFSLFIFLSIQIWMTVVFERCFHAHCAIDLLSFTERMKQRRQKAANSMGTDKVHNAVYSS